jgi:hypothetical protein
MILLPFVLVMLLAPATDGARTVAKVGESTLTAAEIACPESSRILAVLYSETPEEVCRAWAQTQIDHFIIRSIIDYAARHYGIDLTSEELALSDKAQADLANEARRMRGMAELIRNYRKGSLSRAGLSERLLERWHVSEGELEYYLALAPDVETAELLVARTSLDGLLQEARRNQRQRLLLAKLRDVLRTKMPGASAGQLAQHLSDLAEIHVINRYSIPTLDHLFPDR